jgi:hypothetical protein
MTVNFSYPLPNAQNPTLLPNVDQAVSNATGGAKLNPWQFLTANPRVAAVGSLTLSTNPTNEDVLTLTLLNPVLPGGSLAVSISASSDTTTTAAARLAAALTSNRIAMARQIFGSSLGAVLNVNQMGPVGNSTKLQFASTGSTTAVFSNQANDLVTVGGSVTADDVLTLRFTNSSFSGGHEDVAYTVLMADTTTTIATALAAGINADSVLEAAGISATSAAAVINVVQSGPEYAALSNVSAGEPSETLTISDVTGALGGGSGPVIPFLNFDSTQNQMQLRFRQGQPVILSLEKVALLCQTGSPLL